MTLEEPNKVSMEIENFKSYNLYKHRYRMSTRAVPTATNQLPGKYFFSYPAIAAVFFPPMNRVSEKDKSSDGKFSMKKKKLLGVSLIWPVSFVNTMEVDFLAEKRIDSR